MIIKKLITNLKGNVMSKTKFEILMNVEVEDVDGCPVSTEEVCDGIQLLEKGAEALDIRSIHVS